ncbi:hypothetical protein TSUD_251870 [Trifolium subterraneum]|uniref:Pentacotripeptide-repeat region of PRORP domain-containing protein n=1 Tax=Trifolium subterraneum TaxID=3900 RepID=A0A2Z6MT96_TRISU|nr:hypothetical protein TSUD_251870 [Trifolium subterraneum]
MTTTLTRSQHTHFPLRTLTNPLISHIASSSSSFSSLSTVQHHQQPSPSPSSLPDAFLIDKLLFRLKQNDFSSLRNHLLRSNSSSTLTLIPQLLQKCHNYPLLLPNLIQTIASTCPSPTVTSSMVHFLVQSKKLPEAQSLLLRIIRKSGVSRVEARKLREGSEAFRILRGKGLCVSINACNALLGAVVKEGSYERAKSVLDEMLGVGLCPDAATFNPMLVESCRQEDVCGAEKIFNEMLGRGVVPDLISFSSIVGVFSRNGELGRALEYFEKMKGAGLVPDTVIYTILINGQGRMQEAEMVLHKMIDKGINPDKSTYTSLINGHVSKDNLKEAFRVHDEMLQRGFVPDDKF